MGGEFGTLSKAKRKEDAHKGWERMEWLGQPGKPRTRGAEAGGCEVRPEAVVFGASI